MLIKVILGLQPPRQLPPGQLPRGQLLPKIYWVLFIYCHLRHL